MLVSVRCGAHSTPGYSSCDDGIVIDLRRMNRVQVDAGARTARVQGGATWAELDAATQEHGLAVTGGRVSDTGVGGLALGSGSGWLERMYGVTCESLISAEVVTADGEAPHGQRRGEPRPVLGPARRRRELRGRHRVRVPPAPVGPLIAAGLLLYPREQAGEVIRNYRDFLGRRAGRGRRRRGAAHRAARGVRARGAARTARRGRRLLLHRGSRARAWRRRRPLRAFGEPVIDMIQPMPYTALQQMLDAGSPRGVREYFKVDSLRDLSDAAIDTVVAHAEGLPAPFGQLILGPMGGALARTDRERDGALVDDGKWIYFCLAMWMDPAQDEANIAWTRGFHGGDAAVRASVPPCPTSSSPMRARRG